MAWFKLRKEEGRKVKGLFMHFNLLKRLGEKKRGKKWKGKEIEREGGNKLDSRLISKRSATLNLAALK